MNLTELRAVNYDLLWLGHELLHLVLHRRDGIFVGTKPRHGLALLVDNELGEVPLDVAERWYIDTVLSCWTA